MWVRSSGSARSCAGRPSAFMSPRGSAARGYGPPGGVRSVATDVRGGGWPAARRSGLVGGLLSFTPNTIVIDIDAETGVATVHDFVERPSEGAG